MKKPQSINAYWVILYFVLFVGTFRICAFAVEVTPKIFRYMSGVDEAVGEVREQLGGRIDNLEMAHIELRDEIRAKDSYVPGPKECTRYTN